MVETQEKEKTGSFNLLDEIRGVVAPTKPKEAAAKEEEQEDSKAMMQKVNRAVHFTQELQEIPDKCRKQFYSARISGHFFQRCEPRAMGAPRWELPGRTLQ